MAALLGDVRKILAVKMKTRQDSHTDQYNRLVMVKVMLISSFAVGMNWFKDKLKCIVPKSSSFDGGKMISVNLVGSILSKMIKDPA